MTSQNSANIEVYSGQRCMFCTAAKRLLSKLGVEYQEIMVDSDDRLRKEMEQRSGRQTIPQIFINGEHVGGYDDLAELHADGKLKEMLGLTE